jgi:hypothetical protein
MSESQDFFDKPANIKRILNSVYAICGLLVVIEMFIHRHTEHPLEGLFGFYPLYGFVGCVVLVLLATLMRKVLMRDENYYQKNQETVEESSRVDH